MSPESGRNRKWNTPSRIECSRLRPLSKSAANGLISAYYCWNQTNSWIAEDSQKGMQGLSFPLRLFPLRTLRSNVRLIFVLNTIFVLNIDARTHDA